LTVASRLAVSAGRAQWRCGCGRPVDHVVCQQALFCVAWGRAAGI